MENHVAELTRQQRAHGHRVCLLTAVGDLTSADDIRVLARWPLARWRPQLLRDLLFCVAARRALGRQARRFDVVHVHGDWSAFLFARLVASRVGARTLVASVHGRTRRSAVFAAVYRTALRGYAACYATGLDDARHLAAACGRDVPWITSGVPTEWPAASATSGATSGAAVKDPIDVLCVGTLTAVKNLPLAIEVARRMPDMQFAFVGDGPDRAALESAAGGVPNVRFMGRLARSSLPAVYARSRVLLSTSISEGTPTVMLEAMSFGLPIVTSRSNDYAQVLPDARHGTVVEPPEPEHFVHALRHYLGSADALAQARVVNRARAEAFTWPRIARRVTSLMHDDRVVPSTSKEPASP